MDGINEEIAHPNQIKVTAHRFNFVYMQGSADPDTSTLTPGIMRGVMADAVFKGI